LDREKCLCKNDGGFKRMFQITRDRILLSRCTWRFPHWPNSAAKNHGLTKHTKGVRNSYRIHELRVRIAWGWSIQKAWYVQCLINRSTIARSIYVYIRHFSRIMRVCHVSVACIDKKLRLWLIGLKCWYFMSIRRLSRRDSSPTYQQVPRAIVCLEFASEACNCATQIRGIFFCIS